MKTEHKINIVFEYKLSEAKSWGIPNLDSCPYGNIVELEKRILSYFATLDFEKREKLQLKYKELKKAFETSSEEARKELNELLLIQQEKEKLQQINKNLSF